MKAAVEIISALLIAVFAIALFATAYTYFLPIIEKNQDRALVERVDSLFDQSNTNSLPSKIEFVANNGGETRFDSSLRGIWQLFPCADTQADGVTYREGCGNFGVQNNSIEFTITSNAAKYADGAGWISLSGESCPPPAGNLGTDKASVVCVRVDQTPAGKFNVTYRVWFRPLNDATGRNTFKINLLQHPATSLQFTGQSVQASFNNRRTETVGDKTLITSEVKILLT